MQGLCLGFHNWDGCICERCGQARDADHLWAGCVCSRCGQHRDTEHDWETLAGCVRRCVRCAARVPAVHELEGCICRICGTSLHAWKGAACERCGRVCDHPEVATRFEGDSGEETIHARLIKECVTCGMRLNEVWKK